MKGIKLSDYKRAVGRNVMLARESLGLAPGVFAKRIGVAGNTLSQVERGRSFPPPWAIVRACEEFGFSADWFYRGIRAGTAIDVAETLASVERQLNETRQ